jgi:hypothetical protein
MVQSIILSFDLDFLKPLIFLFLEKVWHKEEMLECIDYLSVEELKAFIPRLLASLKVCPEATPESIQ